MFSERMGLLGLVVGEGVGLFCLSELCVGLLCLLALPLDLCLLPPRLLLLLLLKFLLCSSVLA